MPWEVTGTTLAPSTNTYVAASDGDGLALYGSGTAGPKDVGLTFGDQDVGLRAYLGFANAPNAWMTGTRPGDITLFANPGRLCLGSGPDTATPQLMVCNPDNSPDSFRPGLWLGDSAISFATSITDGTGEFIRSNRPSETPNSIGLDFYTGYEPRLSIANNGDVGVGTQNPQAKLDVAGTIKADGGIQFQDGTFQTTAIARGPAGPAGPRGPAGPAGERGPAGRPGVARSSAVCGASACAFVCQNIVLAEQRSPCAATAETGGCDRPFEGAFCCVCA